MSHSPKTGLAILTISLARSRFVSPWSWRTFAKPWLGFSNCFHCVDDATHHYFSEPSVDQCAKFGACCTREPGRAAHTLSFFLVFLFFIFSFFSFFLFFHFFLFLFLNFSSFFLYFVGWQNLIFFGSQFRYDFS